MRLTNRFEVSKQVGPALQYVSVVASYVVAKGPYVVTVGPELVILERYVGDVWKHGEDKKTLDRAEGLQAEITARAKALGLEVRPGRYHLGE